MKPVETSPESVTLEIFQVRLPAGDPHLAEQLWRSVDELRLQVDTRHELIRNGFRAGIVGGTLPDGLAAHMDLQSQQPEVSPERIVTGQNADPTVTRRVVQLNRKDAAAIHTADLQQRVHVLLSEDGGIRGNTYEQAEAVYSLRAEAIAGQRIAVELVPELHHGELRPRYVGGDLGMFLMSQSRKRNTFDGLTMHARLAPGEMLLVSCLHDASGSLGHAFHAQDDLGPSEYKLVLIRLLQAPCSEILAAVER
ncbi:MAG: hypothetical protein MK171_00975 [Pirellulales bacterium]|nr:hypothetical protein [Pirellulales bacterium]